MPWAASWLASDSNTARHMAHCALDNTGRSANAMTLTIFINLGIIRRNHKVHQNPRYSYIKPDGQSDSG